MGVQFPGLGVYQQAFDKHTIQDVNDSCSQGELDDLHLLSSGKLQVSTGKVGTYMANIQQEAGL